MRHPAHVIWIVGMALIGAVLIWPTQPDPSIANNKCALVQVKNELASLKESLVRYHARHGRYPSNDEGLGVLDTFDSRFTTNAAGILTPWRVPYMYENRMVASNALSCPSIVDADRRSRFSVKVADGVYVYSVDAYYSAIKHDHELVKQYAPMALGWLLVIIDVCLVVALKVGRLSLGLLAGAAVGVVMGQSRSFVHCYDISPFFSHRDSHAVSKQIELIEQYHKNGVINDATYRRLLEAGKPAERK